MVQLKILSISLFLHITVPQNVTQHRVELFLKPPNIIFQQDHAKIKDVHLKNIPQSPCNTNVYKKMASLDPAVLYISARWPFNQHRLLLPPRNRLRSAERVILAPTKHMAREQGEILAVSIFLAIYSFRPLRGLKL